MNPIEPYGCYYLTKKIATGGMAELFRARRKVGLEGFDKILAIKRILPHLSNNRDFVAMFADEAKIAAQLAHQNIVQIFDFGRLNETYFIAMEFVLGSNLRGIMEKTTQLDTKLSINDCVYIITKAAIGLDYAHRKRDFRNSPLHIIHRDISPQNILVSYEGEVKLTDFGIAKAVLTSSVTKAGVLKGKVSYMSPEQARGEGLDRRSDIFSLGVLFHELLTYRKLFEGESELQILERLKDPDIEPPSRLNPDIPIELDRIVLKALALRPEDRYQSGEEMFTQCETFLASRDDFPTTNGFRNFLRIIFREDIEREKKEIEEEFGRVRSFEINQEKTHPFTLQSTSLASNEHSLLSRGFGLFRRLKYTAFITGALVLGFLLFLFFMPAPSRTTKSFPTADDHVRYALFCLGRARFDRAIAEFGKAFEREPSYASRYRKQLARVFLERGKANLPGKLQMAIRDLKEARRLDPGNHEAYFQLGRALTKFGKYDEALNQYEQCIAIMPGNPDAHFNLGYIFLGRKEYASAAREFEEVIKLKPPYLSDAYVNLGIARYNAGHLQKALMALKKALQLNPKNGNVSAYIDAVKAKLRKRKP
jgi:serine/threonine protein kinase/outer membrane protein assembly factor BamD (BamD/ComL family)